MATVTVRMEDGMHDAIRRMAGAAGVSLNQWMRDRIRDGIAGAVVQQSAVDQVAVRLARIEARLDLQDSRWERIAGAWQGMV